MFDRHDSKHAAIHLLMPHRIKIPYRTILKSLNCDGVRGLLLLVIMILLWGIALAGPDWTMALRYERTAIGQGEWWRFISAHGVHLGVYHLLLDSAGLLLLWALYAGELAPSLWLWVLTSATAAIDAGLWWGEPQIQWYVGISGVLHGVWAAGALAMGVRGDRSGWLMLVILASKLALEHRAGVSLLDLTMPVVTNAHLYGALGGASAVALAAILRVAFFRRVA